MPRVLEKLKIREVSAVDKGAGEGVKVMLMKRDDPLPAEAEAYLKREFTADQRKDMAGKGEAMPGGEYPIASKEDLGNAIKAFGRAKDPAATRRHITGRARALDATDMLPEAWKVKKGLFRKLLEAIHVAKAADFETAQADTETGEFAQDMLEEFSEAIGSLSQSIASIMCDGAVSDKQAAIDETISQFKQHIQGVVPEGIEEAMRGAALAAAGYEINPQGAIVKKDSATMTEEEKKAAEAKAEAERKAKEEKTEKALAKALREIAVLKMSDKHTAYCAARGDDMSADEKDKFADMEPAERDAHMEKHPVKEDVEKRVQAEVAKRIASDPSVIDMKKRLDEMSKREQITEVRKAWTAQGLTDPQMDVVQKAWEASTDKAPIDAMVKQLAAANAQAREAGIFKEFGGTGNGTGVTPHDELLAKADELRKADPKLTREQAYAKAYEDPANREIAKRDVIARRQAMGAS